MQETSAPFTLSSTSSPSNEQAVSPENWFFYWKMPSSLWRNQMESISGESLIVPINWAFHSETGDTIDLGDKRSETNLKELEKLAGQLGKEVIFFLPLGPCPLMENAGLPQLLATDLACSPSGITYSIAHPEGILDKLYSFFDTRVYQSFSKFIHFLGRFFSQRGMISNIWGMHPGYCSDEFYFASSPFSGAPSSLHPFHPYFIDRSAFFEQAFTRFIQAQKTSSASSSASNTDSSNENENENENEKSIEQEFGHFLSSPFREEELKSEFTQIILDLYIYCAQENLSPNWAGELRVAFLGGGMQDFVQKLAQKDRPISPSIQSKNLFRCLSASTLPSCALLSTGEIGGILRKQIREVVVESYQKSILSNHLSVQEITYFLPLHFFNIYTSSSPCKKQSKSWEEIGAKDHIRTNYQWAYQILPLEQLGQGQKSDLKLKDDDEDTDTDGQIHLFQSCDLTPPLFQEMLKIFMLGGQVILNKAIGDRPWEKKLERFILENSLQVEKINFHIPIKNVSLGEARLLIFEGDHLASLPQEQKNSFWSHLLQSFPIHHPTITAGQGIDIFWQRRPIYHHELDYQEIRRANIYNSTNEKKLLTIKANEHFALTKIHQENNARIQNAPGKTSIELAHFSSITFDYGVF